MCQILWNLSAAATSFDTFLSSGAHQGHLDESRETESGRMDNCITSVFITLNEQQAVGFVIRVVAAGGFLL